MDEQYLELYEKLSRLQWLLQRHHLQSHAERGPAADPTRGQGRVLAMLKMQPDISTKDLSYLLGIRQQSLNELLNKLEKADYLTRTPSEADRRVMLVRLTEKGEGAQRDEPDYSGIFSCLDAGERTTFSEYLDRVIAALVSELGMEGEDEERCAWMHGFRARMGDERAERLFYGRGGWHGDMRGFDRGPRRGHPQGAMPGRERFDPAYGGPMPCHGQGAPCGRHARGWHTPPPPSPPPANPEDDGETW